MVIYVNGCSHTRGHCIKEMSAKNWPRIVSNKLFDSNYKVIDAHNIDENSFIDKKFNYLVYEAGYGSSNERIQFETIRTITKLIKKNIKVDFAFIQFTGVNRRMHINVNGEIENVNTYDNYNLGLRFEPMGTHLTLQSILLLQSFFTIHDIRHIFLPYFKINLNGFDESSFIDLQKFSINPSDGYLDTFIKKKYTCDKQGHPNYIANTIMADDILKKLGYENSNINKKII